MNKSIGYAAHSILKKLEPCQFSRVAPGPDDIQLEVYYCGVCHSDVHQVHNDWKNTVWPCVPGHEIVGRVTEVGNRVTRFKVGDLAAVGCMVDSCGTCPSCKAGDEQYCEAETGWLATYNGTMQPNGQNTFGGYSNSVVVKEHFALSVPTGMKLEAVAPLLCAGVTTYSPLKHFGVKSGMKVGIIGFGGLGHMATQLAKAMGAEVTVFTTSSDKEEDAKRLGATQVILSTDKKQMEDAESQFDFLLSTIPYKHDIDPYVKCLKRDCVLVLVGVLMPEPGWNPQQVIMQRRLVGGSLIGSIQETKEVLEFCQKHRILPQVEVISIADINDVYDQVKNKKARYRFVIDLASLNDVKDKKEELKDLGMITHVLQKKAGKTEAA